MVTVVVPPVINDTVMHLEVGLAQDRSGTEPATDGPAKIHRNPVFWHLETLHGLDVELELLVIWQKNKADSFHSDPSMP